MEKKIQLSPSSINLFLECPACFWLEKKMGIRRPPPYPYTLNSAIDQLLKAEFDECRIQNKIPEIIQEKGIKAHLFPNQQLISQWRSNFSGLRYYDEKLDAVLFGAVDDILEFEDGSLSPLDCKSTGGNVANVYDRFQIQMDIYSYLLERNGFKTNGKAYLAFYIVDKSDGFGDAKLSFKKELHEIETKTDDVPDIFSDAIKVCRQNSIPNHSPECEFGKWYKKVKIISL
ncbi:hypothetical protein HRbin34_00103 [bacterium HR34]|nr:hypothetical protein HRbin34_00103 [bacterium HR34]